MKHKRPARSLLVLGGFLSLSCAAGAFAQCRPVSGCEIPELAVFDDLMVNFMCEKNISAATLAMTFNGVLVHARAYGWADANRQAPLEANALMRIASVSKPITMAAVRQLIAEGRFTLDTKVFDLGQPGGGLLKLDPFPSLGDPRLADITVRHLMLHQGGWDRNLVGDLTYREVQIAGAIGVASPPGRLNTVRYILGQPLQFTPGSTDEYSNIGALVLGLIVEQERGVPLETTLDDIMATAGVAEEDHGAGRTFRADQDPREPVYESEIFATNVFDPAGPLVNRPYGGWDHEARIGQGGHIATAAALAKFAVRYFVNGADIGRPRQVNQGTWNHTGSLTGTQSLIRQRSSGVTYAVVFNSNAENYAEQIRTIIDQTLATHAINWPTVATQICCAADINSDGVVDFQDLNSVISDFLLVGDALPSDINGDGRVDFADLNLVLSSYLRSC